MPNLPQRKVGIVACSGEELPGGAVTRLAALKVLEELRPKQTVTICLPLFLAGGEGDRAFAKFYPTIAVDGCDQRCAARATELYSNKPAANILVDQVLDAQGLPQPASCRRLSQADLAAVHAVADAIVTEVDRLIAVRWSRTEGAVLELVESKAEVSTAPCACGSGVPVTTVQMDEQSIQIMALEPILEMAYNQGLRPTEAEAVPAQIMKTVRIYNQVPEGMDTIYAAAVTHVWQNYCNRREARRETANG